MQKWKKKFLDMNIRGKMICSHILIAMVPLCLLGFTAVFIPIREEGKSIVQTTVQRVEQVQQTLDIYMKGIEKTVNMLIQGIDPGELDTYIDEKEPGWRDIEKELTEEFRRARSTHDEIAGIFLATDHDLYVGTGMSRISRDSFAKEEWYRRAVGDPDNMQIISNAVGRNIVTEETYSVDNVFCVVKAVKNPENGKVVGVLLFDIKYETIASVIQESVIGRDGFAFVLDAQNKMVYAPVNEVIYRISPKWFRDTDELITAKIQGEKYQISCRNSEYTGWKVVSVSSYQEVMRKVQEIFLVIIGVLAISLVIVLLIAVKISATITDPIVKLRNLMGETRDGNLKVRFQGKNRDEVSELGRRFNHMLERIQELLDEVYREQEHKRKAQLQVVQEQFKPHFLYNTLDTIGWMAREHSADDIVNLVDALTNVFRISLSKGKDYITLEEEMKYISNYLYIQKIRYGPKVMYEMELDEEIQKIRIPKLILQPLVENAIYHGVKLKRGEGHLKVSAKKTGDMITMMVEDDGKGMSREKVQQLSYLLNEPTSPEQNQSFGLFYVKERLRIRYADMFRVQVESEEGKGTAIAILIPLQCQEREVGRTE